MSNIISDRLSANKISLDKLTIFSINELIKRGEQAKYENITKEAFNLFPERFCMETNKDWPDGHKIALSIQRCRDRGWITGSFSEGFSITPLGEKTADEIKTLLKGGEIERKPDAKKENIKTNKDEELLLNYIKNSQLFQKMSKHPEEEISEDEFRSFLQVSYEAKPSVCKSRFERLKSAAEYFEDKEAITFLNKLKKLFNRLMKAGWEDGKNRKY